MMRIPLVFPAPGTAPNLQPLEDIAPPDACGVSWAVADVLNKEVISIHLLEFLVRLMNGQRKSKALD